MNTISLLKISINHLQVGDTFEFKPIILDEKTIIEFAKNYDPLPFHTDPKEAEKSTFGKLIASGPQLFNHFYMRDWLPLMKDTIICGLSFDNWRFLSPTFVDQSNHVKIEIIEKSVNEERKSAKVSWLITFYTDENKKVQELTMRVLHKLD